MFKRTCTFPSCQRQHYAHGLCNAHYQQRRQGKALKPIRNRFLGTAEDRFFHYTKITDTCWKWTGTHSEYGYGLLPEGTADTRQAHRYAYTLFKGPIPEGLGLDHLCHTNDAACPGGVTCEHRSCVNPDHLEPIANTDNVMRGRGFAPRHAAQTHCVNGHEFTPENTRIRSRRQGGRECKTCNRDRARKRYQSKKQQEK